MATEVGAVSPTWQEANQRWLTAELERLRLAVARHAGVDAEPEEGDGCVGPGVVPEARAAETMAAETATSLAASMPAAPALEALAGAFGLSPFERDVLLLTAGVELDPGTAELCAYLGDGTAHPTFGLALAALEDAHWSALAPTAPLRKWRLVDVRPGETLVQSPLRIDERVLHHVTGVQHLDEGLVGFVQPVGGAAGDLVPSHLDLARRAAGVWAGGSGEGLPVVQLCGTEPACARAVAAAACDLLGLMAYRLPATLLPSAPGDFDALVRLWTRESILSHAALLLDATDSLSGDAARIALLHRFVEEVGGPLLVATEERLEVRGVPSLAFDVRRPTRAEQAALWAESLGEEAASVNGALERVTAQFDLSTHGIQAAARRSLGALLADAEARRAEAVVWDACRLQARQALGGHARCIEPTARWDDLVLPEPQLRVLREIETHVRHRLQVHEGWGFAARSPRGLGITALFSGPSGTGKTLAAEVLAHALELDLYHVDLSSVVSKYIGETEKNLRRVFDAAEAGGAVLLFDEADALFGRRSEVKDSHDRYANLEVSYLLQRMETYRGLAILTTNLKSALDDAFERRLRFRVAFPFPDAAQRAAIWRCVFPPETPTEGLEPEKLARLDATGGTIRNVVLHAAFLAAEAREPVRMVHLRDAARSVYAQLERPLTESELRGWT